MSDEPNRRERLWRNLLMPLAIIIPALAAYEFLFQLRTPSLDFFLTAPNSPLVTHVVPGGQVEAAKSFTVKTASLAANSGSIPVRSFINRIMRGIPVPKLLK